MSDPPAYKGWKQAGLPPFTPDEIAKLERPARASCDAFSPGNGDVATLYTRHIPV